MHPFVASFAQKPTINAQLSSEFHQPNKLAKFDRVNICLDCSVLSSVLSKSYSIDCCDDCSQKRIYNNGSCTSFNQGHPNVTWNSVISQTMNLRKRTRYISFFPSFFKFDVMNDNASVMNVDGASVSEAILSANETRDIVLPNQNEHVAHIAVDVGAWTTKRLSFVLCQLTCLVDWRFIS